ncbi:glycosyltransferase [Rudanella paleaurantiibacter]|uniref:Glycosyltransferase n=1 Tax=Rudanella paleaurantiibacter TaxID=2614655 RepID=A0A7J5TY46_9BACT|nr:glycosyltransferase [Rudanella paleaurantiibacter]KAB7729353.1 glycosyltransferase [Rudanella paleaurantiibacter]
MASRNKEPSPIRVLCVSPAHPPNDPRILKTIRTLSTNYEVHSLLPWRTCTSAGVLPTHPKLLVRVLLAYPVICWYLLRLRPQILHIFMPELLPVALLFRGFGGRVVYEVQENLRLKFGRKSRNNHPIFQAMFEWFDRWAREHCSFVLTEDSYLTEYPSLRHLYAIVHNFPERLLDAQTGQPIPNLPADKLPLSTQTVHLGYLGLITLDRGLDTMLAVVARLKASELAVNLHLFGRMAVDDASLRTLPYYNDVAADLIFYGHVSHSVSFPILKQCTAGLALLKPVGDYPGSYPSKLFEYMSLGVPVITSDFPLYQDVVERHECGFCVDPTDVGAIYGCIRRLATNPDEANQLKINGQRAAYYHYSWSTEAKKLLELYKL